MSDEQNPFVIGGLSSGGKDAPTNGKAGRSDWGTRPEGSAGRSYDAPLSSDARENRGFPSRALAVVSDATDTRGGAVARASDDPPDDPILVPPSRIAMLKRRWSRAPGILAFLVIVLAPAIAAGLYFFKLAKPQYVSEFRFSITEQTPALPGAAKPPMNTMTAGAGSLGGIASLLTGLTSGVGSMQNFVVTDFVQSREAVEELQRRIGVKALLANDDPWFRLSADTPTEQFLRAWQRMTNAEYDPVTGLALVQIRAFSPDDAVRIATTLMTMSEELVNRIASRAKDGTLRPAEEEVRKAGQRLERASTALAVYRRTDSTINPSTSAVQANNSLVLTQRFALAQLESQLAALRTQNLNAAAPAAVFLRSRIETGRAELRRLESEPRARVETATLAESVGRYEKLDLDRQYANSSYNNAMYALDQARANAAAQHIYLTPYARPHLPQEATYPNRPQAFIFTLIALVLAWLVSLLGIRTWREYRA